MSVPLTQEKGISAINLAVRCPASYAYAQALTASAWTPVRLLQTSTPVLVGGKWSYEGSTIVQRQAGTVVILGDVSFDNVGGPGTPVSCRVRLERSASGTAAFASVMETRGLSATTSWFSGASVATAYVGVPGDTYRLSAYMGNITDVVAGNLVGFFAPGPVCSVLASADTEGTGTWADVALTGSLVQIGTVVANEITLPAGDYLLLYGARFERDSGVTAQCSAQIVSDTGGGYAAITASQLYCASGPVAGSAGGNSCSGGFVYRAAAGEKFKLQVQTDGATCDALAEGTYIMAIYLGGWRGASAYKTSPTAGGSGTITCDVVRVASGQDWALSSGALAPTTQSAVLFLSTVNMATTFTTVENQTLPYIDGSIFPVSVYNGSDVVGTTTLREAAVRPKAAASLIGYVTGYSNTSRPAGSNLTVIELDTDLPSWQEP